ncbi:MAG: ATP-binding protein, partial [Spirochaetota bacterium]
MATILDIRTILIGFVVSDVICALVIGFLWRNHGRKFPGLSFWALDYALQVLSILLLSLRGAIPDLLSMVGGNAVNLAGTIFLLIGLGKFLGAKARQAPNWIMLGVFTLIHTYFSVFNPNLAARNINMGLALIILSAQCAWVLLSKADPSFRRETRFAVAVLSAYCLVTAINIANSALAAIGNDYLKSGDIGALILLADQMLFIALTFSLYHMVNKKLSAALDEDIEARKRTEQELRISEEKYSAAFKSIPDVLMLSSLDGGKILEINENFTLVTGYSREEAIGKTTLDLRLWKDAEDRSTYVSHLQAKGRAENVECVFRKKSGETIIGLISGEILSLKQGAYVLSVIHDVTLQRTLEKEIQSERENLLAEIKERRQAEEALRESESKFRYLASFPALNRNPVLEIGIDGTVRYANPASLAILERLGLAPDVRQFLSDSPEELAHLRLACAAGPVRQEFQLGDAYFLRDISTPGGEVLRVYAADITKRKLLEQQLKELNATLDQRIEQRTAELSMANKELEAFGYSVSHDLRAPLRSIDGFSHALLDDYGSMIPEEGRSYLERIRNAAQRMGQIIEDMLFLSHITRSPLEFRLEDISGIARGIMEDLGRENPGRKIQWNVEPGMEAVCDQRLMRIVFSNLLNNAWKFTSLSGEAAIRVGSYQDETKGTVYFVRDNGTGFDARFKDKLFTAFQRLHAQNDFPGTGIGLASVKRAVQRHGGEVWAEGEVGKGAAFYFSIP